VCFCPLQVTGNAWWTQLRYINAVYFSLEALMVNEFQGSSTDCSAGIEPGLAGLAESALASITGAQRAVLRQLARPQEGWVLGNVAKGCSRCG
jgi:hypothetical protein